MTILPFREHASTSSCRLMQVDRELLLRHLTFRAYLCSPCRSALLVFGRETIQECIAVPCRCCLHFWRPQSEGIIICRIVVVIIAIVWKIFFCSFFFIELP